MPRLRSLAAFAILSVFLLSPVCAAVNIGGRRLLAAGKNSPFASPFHQARCKHSLLICNAYPDGGTVRVQKNRQAVIGEKEQGLAYQECRYTPGCVQTDDQLDFTLVSGIQGTFTMRPLQAEEEVVVVVLEKIQSEPPAVMFQAFAFPANNGKGAQVAIIDAFRAPSATGPSSPPRLRLQKQGHDGHGHGAGLQLHLNCVYAVDGGAYDAQVLESPGSMKVATRVLLSPRKHYVVLRTGDAGIFPENLVIFPDEWGDSRGEAQPQPQFNLQAQEPQPPQQQFQQQPQWRPQVQPQSQSQPRTSSGLALVNSRSRSRSRSRYDPLFGVPPGPNEPTQPPISLQPSVSEQPPPQPAWAPTAVPAVPVPPTTVTAAHGPTMIPVPCWTWYRPCGNVSLGTDLKHPFLGTISVGSAAEVRSFLEDLKVIMRISLIFLSVIFVLVVLVLKSRPDWRPSNKDYRDLLNEDFPLLSDDYLEYKDYMEKYEYLDDALDEDEWRKQRQAEMDVHSSYFLPKANIYRLLAVLHPWGVPGVTKWQWYNWVTRAIFVAGMQIGIPLHIIYNVVQEWQCTGVKSPLWFVYNRDFILGFIVLCPLLITFTGKCINQVRESVFGNYYILAMINPRLEDEPRFKPGAVQVNERLWCLLSMAVTISMSILLQICFFLKVSTFTGDMGDMAITAVTLYFIFDLDDRVLEASPSLRQMYRRAVVRQNVWDRTADPGWLLQLAGVACFLISMMSPIYLCLIITLAWRSAAGVEIGASPFPI